MSTLKEKFELLKKHSFSDVIDYFRAKWRYKIHHTQLWFLLGSHITEQYHYRLKVMNEECYKTGSCIKCGCETTALQMTNRACEGDCYPPMMSRKKWKEFNKAKKAKPCG